jgi:hypothetical protein
MTFCYLIASTSIAVCLLPLPVAAGSVTVMLIA